MNYLKGMMGSGQVENPMVTQLNRVLEKMKPESPHDERTAAVEMLVDLVSEVQPRQVNSTWSSCSRFECIGT